MQDRHATVGAKAAATGYGRDTRQQNTARPAVMNSARHDKSGSSIIVIILFFAERGEGLR